MHQEHSGSVGKFGNRSRDPARGWYRGKFFRDLGLHDAHLHVNQFKFDGLAAGAKASESGLTRDGDAMLRLIADLRAHGGQQQLAFQTVDRLAVGDVNAAADVAQERVASAT